MENTVTTIPQSIIYKPTDSSENAFKPLPSLVPRYNPNRSIIQIIRDHIKHLDFQADRITKYYLEVAKACDSSKTYNTYKNKIRNLCKRVSANYGKQYSLQIKFYSEQHLSIHEPKWLKVTIKKRLIKKINEIQIRSLQTDFSWQFMKLHLKYTDIFKHKKIPDIHELAVMFDDFYSVLQKLNSQYVYFQNDVRNYQMFVHALLKQIYSSYFKLRNNRSLNYQDIQEFIHQMEEEFKNEQQYYVANVPLPIKNKWYHLKVQITDEKKEFNISLKQATRNVIDRLKETDFEIKKELTRITQSKLVENIYRSLSRYVRTVLS